MANGFAKPRRETQSQAFSVIRAPDERDEGICKTLARENLVWHQGTQDRLRRSDPSKSTHCDRHICRRTIFATYTVADPSGLNSPVEQGLSLGEGGELWVGTVRHCESPQAGLARA